MLGSGKIKVVCLTLFPDPVNYDYVLEITVSNEWISNTVGISKYSNTCTHIWTNSVKVQEVQNFIC